MKITKLVIDRAKWGMGLLLRRNPNRSVDMCCLGFLALACGVNPDEIEFEQGPADVPNVDWPAAFLKRRSSRSDKELINSEITNSAINVNDSSEITWKEKELLLVPIFKEAGIKLSFRGKKKRDGRAR